jgi:hypothetical protein
MIIYPPAIDNVSVVSYPYLYGARMSEKRTVTYTYNYIKGLHSRVTGMVTCTACGKIIVEVWEESYWPSQPLKPCFYTPVSTIILPLALGMGLGLLVVTLLA